MDNTSKQYERLAEDWRFQHKLIWEIPTVAVAILAGMLFVIYTEYENLNPGVRIILLLASSSLFFALTVAVAKHRFGADIRTQFLSNLEERMGMEVYPFRTKEAREWARLNGKKLTSDPLFTFLLWKDISAEIMLLYLMFAASILLLGLTIYEIYRF